MLIKESEDELPDLRLAIAGQTYQGDYAASSISSSALQLAKETFFATTVLGTIISPIWLSIISGSVGLPRPPQVAPSRGNGSSIVLPQALSELGFSRNLEGDTDADKTPSADLTKANAKGQPRRQGLTGAAASSTTPAGSLVGRTTPPDTNDSSTRQDNIGSVSLDATGTTLGQPDSSATTAPAAPVGIRVSPNSE